MGLAAPAEGTQGQVDAKKAPGRSRGLLRGLCLYRISPTCLEAGPLPHTQRHTQRPAPLSYFTQPPERNVSRVLVCVWLAVGLTGRLGFALLPVPVAAVLLAPGSRAVLSPHQFLSGCHARSRASSGSSVGVSRRSLNCSAIRETCSAGVGGGGPDDSITVSWTATESRTDPTTPRVSSAGRGGKSSSRRCCRRS